MIVDSSAIVAVLLKETGFRAFASAMDEADVVRLSSGNYLEVSLVIDKRRNLTLSNSFDEFIEEVRMVIEPVTASQALIARRAHQQYGRASGHAARLNFGDCFAYALARDKGEPLLYKGDDFARTEVRSALATE